MSDLLKTPLFDFHLEHGGRMVPFAGYEMPVQYAGILQEHLAVRKHAGLFDVSHMGEARVLGPQALEMLNHVATNDVSCVLDGGAVYSPLCNEEGGVVDDVIIYRHSAINLMVVLNASNKDKDVAWLKRFAKDFDCEVIDESNQWAQLALQGPRAFAILEDAGFHSDIESLKRFRFSELEAHSVNAGEGPLIVSRTGYTGEDGVELYCRPESAMPLARHLLKAGKAHGLELAGLGCRDSLRLEAGYPLYGHEIDDTISPLEAGLGWTVKLSKDSDFVGRGMLEAQKSNGTERKLVHFIVEDRRIARQGSPVFSGDREVGIVVSGTQSPVLDKPIGSALILAGTNVDGLEADVRNKRLKLSVAKPPLNK
ncbi:glycine cleavage system aminomethyltransferase GcvT [Rubellicoccus peritrichatus]|uniref:Aminomethyltransferase n=1 Tax=Rubellicoccus peritrichatus TaxID=3080537 RepID=A0AAQ3QTR0_9BACT|nr:glycine cleavage system aminomethyltransferase GcvT [Puniceicoccus sp. CR14]WOO41596.1 glycine cleavage system aminomethyltransferase GcvT [Puniceicoccus sp. CR14]